MRGCLFWRLSWKRLFKFWESSADADIPWLALSSLLPGKLRYVIVGEGAVLEGEFVEFMMSVGCLVGNWTDARCDCAVPFRLFAISSTKWFSLEPGGRFEVRLVAADKTLFSLKQMGAKNLKNHELLSVLLEKFWFTWLCIVLALLAELFMFV